MPEPPPAETLFAFFNEVGIIGQLSRAVFEARLPEGFILPHFVVLNHLVRVGDGPTPLDLSRAFQVPKTSMTHTLAVLERHGLIRIAPNPKDGRSKCVWITDQGQAFRREAIERLTPDLEELCRRFPVERIAATLPVLGDLRRLMDAMRDG